MYRFLSVVKRWSHSVFGLHDAGPCRRSRRINRLIHRRGLRLEPLEDRALLSVIYVDDTSPGPIYDGTSWATAYMDLWSALGSAAAGQEIRVAQGAYTPGASPATATRADTFQLKSGVAICGGYAGYGAADPNARNVAQYPTVLSGDIGTAGSVADNSYHVVTSSGTDSTAVLDGVTITAGFASGSGSTPSGGGMLNVSASPTLTNCTLIANSASFAGGGMFNSSSSPTLVNCTFIANLAYSYGGGMYNSSSSSPTLTNCTFTANSADSYGFSSSGGGMYNSSSSPTLTNCILWGNTAPSGSQIYNASGAPVVTYCDVQGGYTGTGNINADPQFARSPNSGPDGVWGTADDRTDLHLRLTSPCIDAGKNSAVPSDVTGDLAGNPRFADIPARSNTGSGTSPLVDIGAYEAVPAVQVLPGGPYGVLEGSSQVLAGAGFSPSLGGDPVSYAWDFDGDGLFDDATGASPTFSAVGISAPQTLTIDLRVTDALGAMGTATTVLRVLRPVYVDDSAVGANDGTSWANAYRSLQSALSVAVDGQVLWVAQGTYKPTEAADRTASFRLSTSVSIYGGYAGDGAGDPNQRNVAIYATVLSGDIGTAGSTADNSFHVVTGSGVDSTAVLDGVTITAGNANGSSSDPSGGGIYNTFSSPTLTNCTFTANSASASSGSAYGGGMSNSSSSPTLTNCTFTANSASASSGSAYGGGMSNSSSSPTLTNCTFTANSASASSGSAYGGGIYNSSSSPTLTNCTFTANSASSAGGGMHNSSSSPTLTNCTFTANSAVSSGGGMYNSSSSPTLTNCILWGNTAPSGSQIYNASGAPVVSYCDVQDGYTGAGNINADPQFARSPNSGPDGVWGTADDRTDLHLRLTSPCIDAGKNSAVPSGVTGDLAGNPRFADIPARSNTGSGTSPLVDIGAYEAVPAVQALPGGPYGVLEGSSQVLAGAGFSPSLGGDPVSYAWDFDGDGLFDDATGASPTFSVVGILAPQTLTIALRVTDALGAMGTATTVLRVLRPVYVDDSAVGANDGTSWANAYRSLQSALSAAVEGQVLWVAQGTYKPTEAADRTASFRLRTSVSIYGGYAGDGAGDPDQRNVALYATVLSGDIGTAGSTADNSFHVVTGSGVDSTAVLDGVTITAGNANGSSPDDCGGGMYNIFSSPTLTNCTFTANSASTYGGGMSNSSSSPTLTNCTFTANSTSIYSNSTRGGGMYNDFSSPTLINCAFTANLAGSGGFSCSGGGMYNNYSSPSLTNCTFTANSTSSAANHN